MKNTIARSVEEKKNLVKKQLESKKSVPAFCKENNLIESSFYKWRSLYKNDAINTNFIELTKAPVDRLNQQNTNKGLETPNHSVIEIIYKDFCLKIPLNFDPVYLANVLLVVKNNV